MIAITGATGQLGRLVINSLLRSMPAWRIVAGVRNPAKAEQLGELGVQVRRMDYTQPETLGAALEGVEKLLLISSNDMGGQRVAHHHAVIEAARRADVKLLAYTSVLHADTSPLALAAEHKETEEILRHSGVPFVLLRNGWYIENHAAAIPMATQRGLILGSAQNGMFSAASRADFAEAAAAVLLDGDHAGRAYELAGDQAYSLASLAAEIASQSGQPIVYKDLPEREFSAMLAQVGLPPDFARLLADADACAAEGALFDESRQLSKLIGRPTTPLRSVVAHALKRG